MKQKSLRRTLIAALLTLAAGVAYGQDNATVAKIPFAFRAAGSDLPAGRYRVGPSAGESGSMGFLNLDTGKTVFIRSKAPLSAPVSESKEVRPRLIFQCGGEEGCALSKLWSGTGGGLEFPTPKLTANQRERRETSTLSALRISKLSKRNRAR
jgi:hypothetical protein